MWYIDCVKINTEKVCDYIHDVYGKRNAEEVEQTTYLNKFKGMNNGLTIKGLYSTYCAAH